MANLERKLTFDRRNFLKATGRLCRRQFVI